MSSDTPQFLLHTYFRSSCSARVRIALNLKGLTYKSTFINLLKNEQNSSDYDKLNPSHYVPTLQPLVGDDKGAILTQSIAILEYLDEKYPETPSLLPPPNQPLARAHVRKLAAVIAADTQPVTNARILIAVDGLEGGRAAWAKARMTEGLTAYERLAADQAGRFSYGDEVTMADLCLVPAVWGAQRFGVDLDQLPTVKRVFEELSKEDAVVKAHWKNQEDTPEELRY